MGQIFLTSDLHFNHNKEFVYTDRSFSSVEEMNEAIIEKWNSVVSEEDTVYILGDIALGGSSEENMREITSFINRLKGSIKWIRGNHDSDKKVYELLGRCSSTKLTCLGWSLMIKYKKYHFFLTHFPCLTGNLEKESLKQMTLNLYGHTHQKTNFYEERPYMYHVGVDSHDCYPVNLDKIIEEMNEKFEEYKEKL